MSTHAPAFAVLSLALLIIPTFAADQPVETEAQVQERATERLVLPPDVTAPETTVIDPPLYPTRNFGPAVIAKPHVAVSVTADPFFTVGYPPYPFGGVYGGYYRAYHVPPIYRYGYYYHRPWYNGAYARYPYYFRPPYAYPLGPPAPYVYGPPTAYPYVGAYAW